MICAVLLFPLGFVCFGLCCVVWVGLLFLGVVFGFVVGLVL